MFGFDTSTEDSEFKAQSDKPFLFLVWVTCSALLLLLANPGAHSAGVALPG